MKAKIFTSLVLTQLFFLNSASWADNDSGQLRPHVSDIGGDDHSPGVTIVIFATLLLIGFGIGLTVGRKTKRK